MTPNRYYEPAGVSRVRRARKRYSIRLWSVRHSRFLERLYGVFADFFLMLHPLWKTIGYGRVERPVIAMSRWWFLWIVSFVVAGCGDDAEEPQPTGMPQQWTVHVSAGAPEAVLWAADDARSYLSAMGLVSSSSDGEPPTACIPGAGHAVFVEALLPDSDQAWRIRETRCPGGSLVELSGGGLLGRQYAVYDWLHRLGVRFFHPEEEYVPEEPRWPDSPFDVTHTPAFRWRSVSLHLTHPLELGDAFRLGDESKYDEAKRYIDWQIKNLGSFGTGGIGDAELSDYGLRRGLPRSSGISLYNQQQGGGGILDPDGQDDALDQIRAAIEERMEVPVEERPQFFSVSFNPTEFTEVDDRIVVDQLTFIANLFAEEYPDVELQTTNHGTYGPPTPHYGVRYYDLPQFAPGNLGVKVHSLLFYDLFRPAPIYGNEDFTFLYDFMVAESGTRNLWHFPESAWWLTFDIAVPLYLPITIESRHRDIEGIAHLLEGTLDGHRVFGSGHEWGYWQNEYCSFRMSADLEVDWKDCLADLVSPLGDAAAEAQAVVEDVVAIQERDLVYGNLIAYYAGNDAETEAAQSIGIEFHPLSPPPLAIMSWDAETAQTWLDTVGTELEQSAADYAELTDRLNAVEAQVPERGRPWFEEIRDGVEVTGLRVRHARDLFAAVVHGRLAELDGAADVPVEVTDLLDAARGTTEEAQAAIARREGGYRYAPLDRAVAGGPQGTGDENWTIYNYRYLNRAHHAFYFRRLDDLASAALFGEPGEAGVTVPNALVSVEEPLVAVVTGQTLEGMSIDFGDGDVATPSEAGEVEHTYAAAGTYTLAASGSADGQVIDVEAPVAALSSRTSTGRTAQAVEPEAGVSIINPLLPGLVFGEAGDGTLALGFAYAPDEAVEPAWWVALSWDGAESEPESLDVPIATGTELLTSVRIDEATFSMGFNGGTPTISGQLDTEILVSAIVDVGGFEPVGAKELVADLLGYTPDELPPSIPFTVQWGLN